MKLVEVKLIVYFILRQQLPWTYLSMPLRIVCCSSIFIPFNFFIFMYQVINTKSMVKHGITRTKTWLSLVLMQTSAKIIKNLGFLDATTHLYKRSCPSVRRSVRPSVRRSVRRSVCPVLFSKIEKRHFRSSDDNQIQQGVRKSLKDSFKDIQM